MNNREYSIKKIKISKISKIFETHARDYSMMKNLVLVFTNPSRLFKNLLK